MHHHKIVVLILFAVLQGSPSGQSGPSCTRQAFAFADAVQHQLDLYDARWVSIPVPQPDLCTGELTSVVRRAVFTGTQFYREFRLATGTRIYFSASVAEPDPLQPFADPFGLVGVAEQRGALLCASGAVSMVRSVTNDMPADVGEAAEPNPKIIVNVDFFNDDYLLVNQVTCSGERN